MSFSHELFFFLPTPVCQCAKLVKSRTATCTLSYIVAEVFYKAKQRRNKCIDKTIQKTVGHSFLQNQVVWRLVNAFLLFMFLPHGMHFHFLIALPSNCVPFLQNLILFPTTHVPMFFPSFNIFIRFILLYGR